MSLPNIWHLRRVAETAARACYVCHKPSSSVLITPDNKDYFYVCPVHLTDRHFCSAIVDAEEQAAKRKQEAMAAEIEKVKREYEEKQRRKMKKDNKGKEKEETKTDKDDKDKKKKKNDEQTSSSTKEDEKDKKADSDEKERDDKIASIQKSAPSPSPSADDSPRIFALHKNFYAMRLERLRNIEAAKRNRQRMQDPSFFPSVPSGGI